MIRRLSEIFRGGYYEHRESWNPKHKCRLPSTDGLFFRSSVGDIWKCKCGKRYECVYSRLGIYKDWREIEETVTEIMDASEKMEQHPLYRF